jgi:hypothetical protein
LFLLGDYFGWPFWFRSLVEPFANCVDLFCLLVGSQSQEDRLPKPREISAISEVSCRFVFYHLYPNRSEKDSATFLSPDEIFGLTIFVTQLSRSSAAKKSANATVFG